jgi:hypothetical protein
MYITVMVWETVDNQTGKEISGNWVNAVAPMRKGTTTAPAPATKPKQRAATPPPAEEFEDDIPF